MHFKLWKIMQVYHSYSNDPLFLICKNIPGSFALGNFYQNFKKSPFSII